MARSSDTIMKGFKKSGFLPTCAMAYLAMLSTDAALPLNLNSKVSEQIERVWNARTEKNVPTRWLQTDDAGVSPEEACQKLLESYADSSTVCTCTTMASGNVRFECIDSYCLLCDEALENCGRLGFVQVLGLDGSPPDYIVGFASTFQYTTGDRNETVAIEQTGCDINTGVCSNCAAYVDNELCNSCSYCDDSSGFTVDCEVLSLNSSFTCSFLPDYGVFAGFSYSTCLVDKPDNDDCINSTLLVQGVPVIGTTDGATQEEIASDCNLFNDTAKGVWYSVVGTGGPMLASACSVDTFDAVNFEIYTGEDSCNELQCVASTSFPCSSFGAGGIVFWNADDEVTYHVRVATQNYQTQFQIYSLDVPIPDNIACTAGRVGNIIDTIGSTLELSGTVEKDICGETGTAGLWYTYVAVSDSVVRASTCSRFTSMYTTISVATGVDCDGLSCVISNSALFGFTSGCENGGIFADWKVTAGLTYFIYVRGAESNGIFGLTINPLIVPNNDLCTDALILAVDDSVTGSIQNATRDIIAGDACPEQSYQSTIGVWYKISGDGDGIRVTACSKTFAETQISVYIGDCSKMACLAEGRYSDICDSGGGRTVSWQTTLGQNYYLNVYQPYETGSFDMLVERFVPAPNDLCTNALMLAVNGSVTGNTQDATRDDIAGTACPEQSYQNNNGIWYQITGDGDAVLATACSDAVETLISVYTGDCSNLECLTESRYGDACDNGGGRTVSWQTTRGRIYYLYVYQQYGTGSFSMLIEAFVAAPNDLCTNALMLAVNGSITGSTEDATRDDIAGVTCPEQSYQTTNGIWYQITGNDNSIRATACSDSFDTLISVYTGECSELICLIESRYSEVCGTGVGRTVSWQATRDRDYLLNVYQPFGTGSFELLVEEFASAPNSQCSEATGLMSPSNQTIMGSTLTAVPDDVVSCATGESNSRGLWFWLVGQEGLAYRVDTCSNLTLFDTAVSVYTGDCDGALNCLVGNDDSCGSGASAVQWKTEEGVIYYIKIYGYFGAVGDFEMTISSFPTPVSDECTGSIPITSTDGVIEVSTTGATPDNITYSGCGYYSQFYPGAWYRIEGKDMVVTLSTCSSLTTVSSSIVVLEGSCDNLICIAEGVYDNDCQETFYSASVASFLGEEGKEYFILVHSTEGSGGAIGLNFAEFDGVDNDFCPGAIPVTIDGEISGATAGATAGGMVNNCGIDGSSPDVWYSVVGTGDILAVTACDTDFNLLGVSILGGSCSDHTCIGNAYIDQDGCTSVRFASAIGETYYISLAGSAYSESSEFSLLVKSSSAAGIGNELCSGAEPIELNVNSTISGSTVGAIHDYSIDDPCFAFSTSGNQWYRVVGSGAVIIASLCGPDTDFDSHISIYASLDGDTSCANLECIASNDDACSGVASRTGWNAEADKAYYIRVSGYGNATGNFVLDLQEQSGGRICQDGDIIELSDASPLVTVEGSTANSSLPGFLEIYSCGLPGDSADAWFRVRGQNGEITATTCSEATDFDTTIEVYEGSCDWVSCVNSNDDSRSDFGTALSGCSLVSWTAFEGVEYYLRIAGFAGAQGSFELALSLEEFGVSTLAGGDY